MTARRCAYLTMANADGWIIDAGLGFTPLEAMGWVIEEVPWRAGDSDWDSFDAVYLGTPWDYPEDPQRFMAVLESIDRSSAVLVNDIALVRWTLSKSYLRDLQDRGMAIVPSYWGNDLSLDVLHDACDGFDVDKIVVKPVINTNATHTFLLDCEQLPDRVAELREIFDKRSFVIQPFIEDIQSSGESSLFYFGGQFSHAIQKIPKQGDFRVQEEYGAEITAVEPEPMQLDAGKQLMQLVDPVPVYARADFVPGPGGGYLLMELEVIEPSLYLRMDTGAPQRFAEAFDEYVTNVSGETSRD